MSWYENSRGFFQGWGERRLPRRQMWDRISRITQRCWAPPAAVATKHAKIHKTPSWAWRPPRTAPSWQRHQRRCSQVMLCAGEKWAPSCLPSPLGAQGTINMGRGVVTSCEFGEGCTHATCLSGAPPTAHPGMMVTTLYVGVGHWAGQPHPRGASLQCCHSPSLASTPPEQLAEAKAAAAIQRHSERSTALGLCTVRVVQHGNSLIPQLVHP